MFSALRFRCRNLATVTCANAKLNRSNLMHCRMSSQSPSAKEINENELKTKDSTLHLSEDCVKQLKNVVSDGSFLRVTVEGGGCSGFQYNFALDTNINEAEDKVFESDGVKVVTDETSLEFLKGATIDYHKELIRSAFRVINNPKADSGCSCGASFSVKI